MVFCGGNAPSDRDVARLRADLALARLAHHDFGMTNPTNKQIRQLRTESAAAGDHAQVLICDLATAKCARRPSSHVGHQEPWAKRYAAAAHETGWGVVDTVASGASTDNGRYAGGGAVWVTEGDWSLADAERRAALMNSGGK